MNGLRDTSGVGVFYKRFANAEAARTAIARGTQARYAGIATPRAWPGRTPDEVAFDRIEEASPTNLGDGDLGSLLRPLAGLARYPVAGLGPFDPFRRIDPRLPQAPDALRRRIDALRLRDFPAKAAVHGDFHPGQVLADAEGCHWLIDLDDMAIAQPEADLGNLAAHLATRDIAPRTGLYDRVSGWEAAVVAAWLRCGQSADPVLVSHFTEIALYRRALKRAERGDPSWVHGLTDAPSAA